ncbi:hypothetical protein ACOSP7_003002 [Xanthoceras sorbifolium]
MNNCPKRTTMDERSPYWHVIAHRSILSFVSLPPLLTLSLVEVHATSRQTLQLFTPSVTKRCWFAVQFSTNPSYPEHLQLEWEML